MNGGGIFRQLNNKRRSTSCWYNDAEVSYFILRGVFWITYTWCFGSKFSSRNVVNRLMSGFWSNGKASLHCYFSDKMIHFYFCRKNLCMLVCLHSWDFRYWAKSAPKKFRHSTPRVHFMQPCWFSLSLDFIGGIMLTECVLVLGLANFLLFLWLYLGLAIFLDWKLW